MQKLNERTTPTAMMVLEKTITWFKRNLLLSISIPLSILFLLLVGHLLYHLWNCIRVPEVNSTGELGDAITGLTSPLINLLSLALIYYTLREQRMTNKIQAQSNISDQHFRRTESIESDLEKLQNEDSNDKKKEIAERLIFKVNDLLFDLEETKNIIRPESYRHLMDNTFMLIDQLIKNQSGLPEDTIKNIDSLKKIVHQKYV